MGMGAGANDVDDEDDDYDDNDDNVWQTRLENKIFSSGLALKWLSLTHQTMSLNQGFLYSVRIIIIFLPLLIISYFCMLLLTL